MRQRPDLDRVESGRACGHRLERRPPDTLGRAVVWSGVSPASSRAAKPPNQEQQAAAQGHLRTQCQAPQPSVRTASRVDAPPQVHRYRMPDAAQDDQRHDGDHQQRPVAPPGQTVGLKGEAGVAEGRDGVEYGRPGGAGPADQRPQVDVQQNRSGQFHRGHERQDASEQMPELARGFALQHRAGQGRGRVQVQPSSHQGVGDARGRHHAQAAGLDQQQQDALAQRRELRSGIDDGQPGHADRRRGREQRLDQAQVAPVGPRQQQQSGAQYDQDAEPDDEQVFGRQLGGQPAQSRKSGVHRVRLREDSSEETAPSKHGLYARILSHGGRGYKPASRRTSGALSRGPRRGCPRRSNRGPIGTRWPAG